MKPAFLLMCYLAGNPQGTMHLSSIKNCIYFRDHLHKQVIKIGDESKSYECFCKLVTVNDKIRLW